jgi:uncharacterized RDD family membrane protein YckC
MLDTTRPIETPEGIELNLRVAGPAIRALAWVIDFGIRIIIYLALLFIFSSLGKFGIGLLLISIFFLEWFYPVLFEVYRQGATPGKRKMKIKVLHERGTPINWSASMIRNLLRVVDFLPFLYGFGLITMLFNQDFKRIGDLVAGTVVVYEEELLVSKTNIPDEPPLTMPVILGLKEQQAIINFADRAQQLSKERSIELANIVTPLTGKTGEIAIKHLYKLANGLIGIRITR